MVGQPSCAQKQPACRTALWEWSRVTLPCELVTTNLRLKSSLPFLILNSAARVDHLSLGTHGHLVRTPVIYRLWRPLMAGRTSSSLTPFGAHQIFGTRPLSFSPLRVEIWTVFLWTATTVDGQLPNRSVLGDALGHHLLAHIGRIRPMSLCHRGYRCLQGSYPGR